MNTDVKLTVTEIQRFCMHDGPGIRTTVFLKGCPLRCAWCHNPETQRRQSELLLYPGKCIFCKNCENVCKTGAHAVSGEHVIVRENCKTCFDCVKGCPTGALETCGNAMTTEDILSAALRDTAFYGDSGGITLSGGEPFMQGDGVVELLRTCKAAGLSTAVETCGYADTHILREAAKSVDLFLWDIKDTNKERHEKYTGASNSLILENLNVINETGARIRLRCILVNGVNTHEAHYAALANIAARIKNFDGLEIIPYHAYGGSKSVFLGRKDNGRSEWVPTEDQIREAKSLLKSEGALVFGA